MNAIRIPLVTLSLLALTAGMLLVQTTRAEAHEHRHVGDYTFVVGFLNEPALLNEPNGIDLRVSRADETPVEGLEQTLRAVVKHGDDTLEVQLRPRFRTPGAYDGRFFPTAKGAYTFQFTGTIEGNPIDEVFTPGPDTFSMIEAPLGFPVAVSNPSNSDAALYVGIFGVVLGGLGLVTAGYSLTRKAG